MMGDPLPLFGWLGWACLFSIIIYIMYWLHGSGLYCMLAFNIQGLRACRIVSGLLVVLINPGFSILDHSYNIVGFSFFNLFS